MRHVLVGTLALIAAATTCRAAMPDACGEVIAVETHEHTTTRYTLALPPVEKARGEAVVLVMLVGGGGYLNLGSQGCPQLLSRNSLMRMRPLLHGAGIATALVDAPSDMFSDEGLGGFRIATEHAGDLGKVIADVRARTRGTVWLIGHSRGTISVVNAAAKLSGNSAPNGVVLLSAMMVGDRKARKPWVVQTVFSVDLDAIKVPVLAIGHAADNCLRSPADRMGNIIAKTRGPRQQAVVVTGGPVAAGRVPDLASCEVREPHDFVDQEAEVATRITRFIRGEN